MTTVYTRTPWLVTVAAAGSASSTTPAAGFVWIVRGLGLQQGTGTGSNSAIQGPTGINVVTFWPTTNQTSIWIDLRLRLESGQTLKAYAYGTALNVTMTVYEFQLG